MFVHDFFEGIDQFSIEFVIGEPRTSRQLDRRLQTRQHEDLASRELDTLDRFDRLASFEDLEDFRHRRTSESSFRRQGFRPDTWIFSTKNSVISLRSFPFARNVCFDKERELIGEAPYRGSQRP